MAPVARGGAKRPPIIWEKLEIQCCLYIYFGRWCWVLIYIRPLDSLARVIFQRQNPRPTNACRPPRCPWATLEGRARKGCGAGRGGGRCRGSTTGRGAGLGLWDPGGARAPRHATTAAAAGFANLANRRDWDATGQLSDIWLGLWSNASGGAAQSVSMFIYGVDTADEDGLYFELVNSNSN